MWLSVVEVTEASLQFAPLYGEYCHLSSVPSPVTDDASFRLPVPTLVVTVGVTGLPGLVRKSSLASSFAVVQVLSL